MNSMKNDVIVDKELLSKVTIELDNNGIEYSLINDRILVVQYEYDCNHKNTSEISTYKNNLKVIPNLSWIELELLETGEYFVFDDINKLISWLLLRC